MADQPARHAERRPWEEGARPHLQRRWCPHCAADSWPLAIALSRFGAFAGLRTIDSGTYYGTVTGAKPAYPHTKA